MEETDIVIIGAGVVGLSIAAQVSRKERTVILVEKHSSFGEETSSRNSEVIHAGIYYPKGSFKAKLCVEGNILLYQIDSICTWGEIKFHHFLKRLLAAAPVKPKFR